MANPPWHQIKMKNMVPYPFFKEFAEIKLKMKVRDADPPQ